MIHVKAGIEGIRWPSIPTTFGRTIMSILYQLEQSQWWPPEAIREFQFEQLRAVIQHAYDTVPWYRQRFNECGLAASDVVNSDDWRRVPLLSREDIQQAGHELHSSQLPESHGRTHSKITSGSTGRPVMTLGTDVTGLFWQVFTLRDHLWHERDFQQTLAVIRYVSQGSADPPDGRRFSNWGPGTDSLIETGPCGLLSIASTVSEQADWLVRQQPAYLLTYPSSVQALARHCAQHGLNLPALHHVRTFGEIVEPGTREDCERNWGAQLVDVYSTQEVGYVALQCPVSGLYHVQAEDLLVEILDDEGNPCSPGEVGRVILTTLHNFAMPLLRYDVGDYAEVGERCPCGRGLPVLRRIMGRQRNMFVLPSGERIWPSFELDHLQGLEDVAPVNQFQVIQRDLHNIEVKLVAARHLTAIEEDRVRTMLDAWFRNQFQISFAYVDEIPRSPHGKYEEFRCDVASANAGADA